MTERRRNTIHRLTRPATRTIERKASHQERLYAPRVAPLFIDGVWQHAVAGHCMNLLRGGLRSTGISRHPGIPCSFRVIAPTILKKYCMERHFSAPPLRPEPKRSAPVLAYQSELTKEHVSFRGFLREH